MVSISIAAVVSFSGPLARENGEVNAEVLLMLALFVCGALAGLLARWGPLSGWAVLAFALILAPLGVGLTRLFC